MQNKTIPNCALYLVLFIYTLCLYGPMAMMSIGAGLIFAVFLFFITTDKDFRAGFVVLRSSPLFIPTCIYGIACLWSLVWARLSGLEFYGHRPTIDWFYDTRKIWHLFFPFILFPFFFALNEDHFKKVLRFWFVLGLVLALFGIAQHYLPIYDPQRLPHLDYENYKQVIAQDSSFWQLFRGKYHATGFTGFHLSYAAIIAFPASVSLALLAVLTRRGALSREKNFSRIKLFTVSSLSAVIFFLANLVTYSKVAWIAMPLTVLLLSVIGFRGRIRYFLIIAMIVFGFVWTQSSEFKLRFQGSDTIKDRLNVWDANLEMIKQHPLFGIGWHRNSELSHYYYEAKQINGFESHAHNNWIDQWATTGVFGLFTFLWWTIVSFRLAYQLYRTQHDLIWRTFGLGVIGGFFCLHLQGLTQANWWDAKVLHQIGWVTAVLMVADLRFSKRVKK